MPENKRYIGDSVYIAHDGYYLILTTENGEQATNTILLEPAVLDRLINFVNEKTGEE
jgi:hypothetical protein